MRMRRTSQREDGEGVKRGFCRIAASYWWGRIKIIFRSGDSSLAPLEEGVGDEAPFDFVGGQVQDAALAAGDLEFKAETADADAVRAVLPAFVCAWDYLISMLRLHPREGINS